jgi:hypothetical protein
MGTILAYTDAASGEFRIIDFDVITGEDHQISSTISEHPVEEGANISDHVRPNLTKVTLKGIASDTPVNPTTRGVFGEARTIQGQHTQTLLSARVNKQLSYWNIRGGYAPLTIPGQVPFISGLSVPTNGFPRPFVAPEFFPAEWGYATNNVSGYFLQFPNALNRVENIFRQLEGLCLLGVPVELTTDVRWYKRMLITSVGAPKDGTSGMEFTIQLQELRTAKTQRTTVKRRKIAKPVEKRAEEKSPQGKKNAGIHIKTDHSLAHIVRDHVNGTGLAAPEVP